MSVPQFGAWDGNGNLPDYSMDFSKIRESRKQNKKDISRASIGNEEELANPDQHDRKNDQKYHDHHHQQPQQQVELPMHDAPNNSPSVRYWFNCSFCHLFHVPFLLDCSLLYRLCRGEGRY